jgi:hypothetical protein
MPMFQARAVYTMAATLKMSLNQNRAAAVLTIGSVSAPLRIVSLRYPPDIAVLKKWCIITELVAYHYVIEERSNDVGFEQR